MDDKVTDRNLQILKKLSYNMFIWEGYEIFEISVSFFKNL